MDEEFEVPRRGVGAWLLGLLLVGGLAGAGYAFLQLTTPNYDASALLSAGVDEEAEIISAQATGRVYEGRAVYEVELQVSDPEGRGYRVFHQQPFAAVDEPRLVKTTRVAVKVDPDDPRKLWVTAVLPDGAP